MKLHKLLEVEVSMKNLFQKKLLPIALSLTMIMSMFPAFTESSAKVLAAENQTPVDKYGKIQICHIADSNTAGYRAQLCDENGNPIQLKGMSTFGLQWDDGSWVLNDAAFDALAYDWQCDIIRLAMYVGETGYATDPATILARVEQGIELATERGMYVIVDWHMLNPGNVNSEVYLNAGLELDAFDEILATHPDYTGPQAFFAYLSEKYGDYENLIFETANEPNGHGGQDNRAAVWDEILLPCHESVVSAIREYDKDDSPNICILGTDNWSQFVDAPVGNTLVDPAVTDGDATVDQIMYTFHFYAGTHDTAADENGNYWLGSMIDNAIDNGLAVFCTEWGTSEATGDGGPYIDYSIRWIDYMEDNGISWCSWSLAKKNEVSAAMLGSTPVTPVDNDGDGIPDWTSEQLSITGNFVRAMIRGDEVPMYGASEVYVDWDSHDATPETASDGQITDYVTSQVEISEGNEALLLPAATAETNRGNIWDGARIVVNPDVASIYTIYQTLEFDVYVENPIALSIQPVLQAAGTSWWGQMDQVNFAESDFTLDDATGLYVATGSANLPTSSVNPDGATKILFMVSNPEIDVYLDNLVFSSLYNGDISKAPVIPDEPGTFDGLPFDFESDNRESWAPEGTSNLDYLTMDVFEIADGNHAMGFPTEFAVGANEWEDGYRMSTAMNIFAAEDYDYDYMTATFYIEKDAATTGTIQIEVCPIPNGDGYWFQLPTGFEFDPTDADAEVVTMTDGTELLKFELTIPFEVTYASRMRNIIFAIHGNDTDYTGMLYLDNIGFTDEAPVVEEPAEPTPTPTAVPTAAPTDAPDQEIPDGDVSDADVEAITAFVNRLYETALGRTASDNEVASWVDPLVDREACGSSVAYGFLFSPEYLDKNVSDEQFVEDLYTVLMDRVPSAEEASNWTNALAGGMTREEVFAEFANSPEYNHVCYTYGIITGAYIPGYSMDQLAQVNMFVDRLYRLCLDRPGDPEGQYHWVEVLVTGEMNGATVAYGFFFSPEFIGRNFSNGNYVEILYNVCLNRPSDPNGYADWTSQLADGADRMDIFRGFVHSDEFTGICADYGIERGTI